MKCCGPTAASERERFAENGLLDSFSLGNQLNTAARTLSGNYRGGHVNRGNPCAEFRGEQWNSVAFGSTCELNTRFTDVCRRIYSTRPNRVDVRSFGN